MTRTERSVQAPIQSSEEHARWHHRRTDSWRLTSCASGGSAIFRLSLSRLVMMNMGPYVAARTSRTIPVTIPRMASGHTCTHASARVALRLAIHGAVVPAARCKSKSPTLKCISQKTRRTVLVSNLFARAAAWDSSNTELLTLRDERTTRAGTHVENFTGKSRGCCALQMPCRPPPGSRWMHRQICAWARWPGRAREPRRRGTCSATKLRRKTPASVPSSNCQMQSNAPESIFWCKIPCRDQEISMPCMTDTVSGGFTRLLVAACWFAR